MTHRYRRLVATAAALAAGVIHLVAALAHNHGGHGGSWLTAAFLAVGVAMVVGATSMATRWSVWTAGGTATISSATAAAYLVSRRWGLPGHPAEDFELLGAASLVSELVVVVAATLPARPHKRWRQLAAVTVALGLAVPAVAIAAEGSQPRPETCVHPTRSVHLVAAEVPGSDLPRLGYKLATDPGVPRTPGPLIEMTEGECIAITLRNEVSEATLAAIRDRVARARGLTKAAAAAHPLGVSLHVHGVKYTVESDGTLGTDSWVRPGTTKTYIWYAAPRTTVAGRVTSLGTAGYWWYHDHVVGTSHGTGGVDAGLWGGLVVRRATDVRPDRTYVVGMGPGPVLTGGADLAARKGERVEFVVVGVPGLFADDDFHEFHLHGHNWADNRTGMVVGPGDETRIIDAKTIGPSETFGFQVVAGEEVGPGEWMLHCHVQEHSDAGMSTFFRVGAHDGPPAAPAVASDTHDGHTH